MWSCYQQLGAKDLAPGVTLHTSSCVICIKYNIGKYKIFSQTWWSQDVFVTFEELSLIKLDIKQKHTHETYIYMQIVLYEWMFLILLDYI